MQNVFMPLQNGQSKSNIKIAKNIRKTILQPHESCSVQKKRSKKHQMLEN